MGCSFTFCINRLKRRMAKFIKVIQCEIIKIYCYNKLFEIDICTSKEMFILQKQIKQHKLTLYATSLFERILVQW